MRLSAPLLAAACLFPLLAAPAGAQDYLTGYGGWFDLIDQDEEALQVGGEYRFSPIDYGIRPTLGASVTTDGGLYGYGGINWDIPLIPNQIYLIPNFMAGAYSNGDGKDLGSAIEFRSGLEVAYQMPNAHRIGVAFNHISNASIGDKNPGAESLFVTYSIPTGNILGR